MEENSDINLISPQRNAEVENLNADEDDDDDVVQLSAATLAALQEFYGEQEVIQKAQESALQGATPNNQLYQKYNEYVQAFPEDWRLSQFWYDEETSATLANEVLRLGGNGTNGKVACISCPSVFRACGGSDFVDLYEFDKRFEVFGKNYFFYDYNFPEGVADESVNAYSVLILDPPVLALECLEKVAVTIKKLAKADAKIILCTGAVMEGDARRLLSLVKTSFIPKHKKNLGNEFSCFANYDLVLPNSKAQ